MARRSSIAASASLTDMTRLWHPFADMHAVRGNEFVIARGDGVRRTFVTDPDRNMIELMEFGAPVTGSEPRLTAPRRSG